MKLFSLPLLPYARAVPSRAIRIKFARFLPLLLVLAASSTRLAWAHGGVDDEPPAPASTTATAVSNATETAIEVRLEDLQAASAGTSAPLVGARISGFLKHDDGDILSPIRSRPSKTPGSYTLLFRRNEASVRFDEPSHCFLELNIHPAKGDSVQATLPFTLIAAAPPAAPLWQRMLRPLLFVVPLLLAAWLFARWRSNKRRTPTSPTVASLLLFGVLLSSTRLVQAHGGVDDEKPTPAPISAASTDVAPNIQLGETTSTVTAGNIRVTMIARTTPAVPKTLAPGEVQLPAQTANLLQIKTATATLSSLSTGVSFSGQIAPNPNGLVRVASLVPGRVTRLTVGQGDTVRAGQVVAVVQSRAVGEAQSAYQQALARANNAQSNLRVVQEQAQAGVFSQAPLLTARQAQAQAEGDARSAVAAQAQARVAYDNAIRLARVGGFASPALELARNNEAQSREALRTAQAALTNAQASVQSAQAELSRRQQQAKAGLYVSRPVQESQRALVAAQSARAAAQSEVATTRANLSRATSLAAEGLVSRRDLETAQQAFDTATARLATAQADERAAQQELSRQQQLASTNVAGTAEVGQARAALATTQADVRTRDAEVQRGRSQLQISQVALSRERAIFKGNIANRREVGTAQTNLQSAQAKVFGTNRVLDVANATLAREQRLFRANLNNISPLQTARAAVVQAQADLQASRSALSLLQAAPGRTGSGVDIPIRAPISGVVQTRDAALGELVQADTPLMTIINLNSVVVEAALFEQDFSRVQVGAPVTITTDAFPNRTFTGRIAFLGTQADPQTRTLTARALIANLGGLRPGMFARGKIETGRSNRVLTVPASAVLSDGAAQVVFVAQGDNYERREVAVGMQSNNRIEIKSGVRAGESVVTSGAAALRAQAAQQK